MDTVQRALVSSPPLSLSLLSELGRGPLRDFMRRNDPSVTIELAHIWAKLVATAESPQVTNKHITAAANALCVFLNTGATSEIPATKALVLSKETWFSAFRCAHKAFDEGKTKPAFQILETVCNLVHQADDPTELLTRSTLPLLRTLILGSPRSDLKKACLMLSCFVRKTSLLELLDPFTEQVLKENALNWSRCLSHHDISLTDISSLGYGSISSFLFALIFATIDLDTRTSALKLCSILCDRSSDSVASPCLQPLTEKVVELFLERNHPALGYFAENVLPVILSEKTRLIAFVKPYAISCRQQTSSMAVFLAALKVGRSKNVLPESEMLELMSPALPSRDTQGESFDLYSSFEVLLTVEKPELRILSYGLLTLSPAANAIVPSGVLDVISSSMDCLYDETDAHERGEILSITRRLLRRLQASSAVLSKSVADKDVNSANNAILAHYRSFFHSMYRFLKSELSPQTSYQRHILSLQTLQCLLDHATEPEIYETDIMLVQLLANLALDPFEDVRATSAMLLKKLAIRTPQIVAHTISLEFMESIKILALDTVRGDHADGMGRLWALHDLLPDTRNHIPEPGNDIFQSSQLTKFVLMIRQTLSREHRLGTDSTLPIHGSLLAVSYCIQDSKTQQDTNHSLDPIGILEMCAIIWHVVRPILCVDSPETAYEVENEESKQGPKDLLAYSWRALRDSSLVMQSLLLVAKADSPVYSSIGDICMDQLISLRHRGAFSTVAQTFGQCCERVRASSNAEIRGLVQKWYTIALNQIYEQADRLTRRSAGLPAMLLALLSPVDYASFSSAVTELISISRTPVKGNMFTESAQESLPQVHALNCLKEIMTNSRFSTAMSSFLNPVLELAAASLSSKIWAIRNCGLMLLRACINRLASSNEYHLLSESQPEGTASDSPTRIALRLLEPMNEDSEGGIDSQARVTENIFVALDLLGHATAVGERNEAIDASIIRHLCHSSWSVRDHAAFILSKRLAGVRPSAAVNRLIDEQDATSMSQNQVHGTLLCSRYILQVSKRILDGRELDLVLTHLALLIDPKFVSHCSPYINSAWLDVVNDSAALVLMNQWNSSVIGTLGTKVTESFADCKASVHSPYFQRRLLLSKIYVFMLGTNSTSTIFQPANLVDELVSNPDSLEYALDNLSDKHFWSLQSFLVLFLAHLIRKLLDSAPSSHDLLILAITTLVNNLSVMSTTPLEELQSILALADLAFLDTREGMNAAVQLEPYLLFSTTPVSPFEQQFNDRVSRWIATIQFASMDLLNFPTRWSAAKALLTYSGLRRSTACPKLDRSKQLSLEMVMYDLLNDDDEEVRSEAVKAVSQILSDGPPHELGLCPIAARKLLLRTIVQEHGNTPDLAESAAIRIMTSGDNADETSHTKALLHAFRVSAASKLQRVCLSKNDLFAEERQNLYIDDVQEVKIWTQVLKENIEVLTQDQLKIMATWVSEGLTSVLSTLQNRPVTSNGKHIDLETQERRRYTELADLRPASGHPFGPTYDQELLIVLVQVVSMAGALLYSRLDHIAMRRQIDALLAQIQQCCQVNQLNEAFVTAVDEALAEK